MKTNAFLVVITVAFSFLSHQVNAVNGAVDEAIVQKKLLNEQGFESYFETVQSEKWGAPLIRSKWAVSNTANPSELNQLRISFELGEQLLAALDVFRSNNLKTIDVMMDRVLMLTEFSEWIASRNGYGNALLARRSLDLALPLIGQILIDPNVTDENIFMLEKLLKPTWATVAYAAAVLDGEMNGSLFAGAKDMDDLRSLWRAGVRQELDRKNPNWAKVLPPGFLTTANPLSVQVDPAKLSFFIDEPIPSKPTTAALMSGKHHELLVTGIEPSNTGKLRELLHFRSALKGFPDESVKSDFHPGLKGAFDEAWRSYCKSNKLPQGASLKVGLAAWNAYEMIRQGKLITEDETSIK